MSHATTFHETRILRPSMTPAETVSFVRPVLHSLSLETQNLFYPLMMELLKDRLTDPVSSDTHIILGELTTPTTAIVCYSEPRSVALQAQTFIAFRDGYNVSQVNPLDAPTSRSGRHLSVERHSTGRRSASKADETKEAAPASTAPAPSMFPVPEDVSLPCIVFVSSAFSALSHLSESRGLLGYLRDAARIALLPKPDFTKDFREYALKSVSLPPGPGLKMLVAGVAEPSLLVEGPEAATIAKAVPSVLTQTVCEILTRTLSEEPGYRFQDFQTAGSITEQDLPALNDFSPQQLLRLKGLDFNNFTILLPTVWLLDLTLRLRILTDMESRGLPAGHPWLKPSSLLPYTREYLEAVQAHFNFPPGSESAFHLEQVLKLKRMMDFLHARIATLESQRYDSPCTWLCCMRPSAPSKLQNSCQTILDEMMACETPIAFQDPDSASYKAFQDWEIRIRRLPLQREIDGIIETENPACGRGR